MKKSKEDYLRAIYSEYEKLEDKSKGVKAIDIVKSLNISKPSVSEMIKNLTKEGFLKAKIYSNIFLTKKGGEKAKLLTFKHRVIEGFLLEVLKLDKESVHRESHNLEHAFSDECVMKLMALLKNKNSCPHGKPIPKITGE